MIGLILAAGIMVSTPVKERSVVVPDPTSWTMAQKTAPEKWIPAVVPGTVLTTLVKNGIVPDPYWGLNNRIQSHHIPDLSDNRDFYTATYRAKVTIPEEWLENHKTVWMRPEGINYRGGIKLNGKFVTGTVGTFARVAVDVTEFVKAGENDIEIAVLPVDQSGQPKQKSWGAAGEWSNGGDGEIGRNVTALMCAGWDFMFSDGVRDRYAGIWKDVTFFATDTIRLDAPYVRTKLNGDMSEAELTLEIDCISAGFSWPKKWEGVLEAEVEGTDVRFSKPMSFFRGERRTERLTATLRNPKLWWPRNKGEPKLYTLKARFRMGERKAYDPVANRMCDRPPCVSDEVTVRFGVREFKSDQSGKGGARQFYVNRRPIFIRGTNWIPEGMLRQDDARMAAELRLTAESGVNMVRLWAGGITESDYFYQLCDEYGLLVWQEFWMSGDTRHPDDPDLYLACVKQQVKRIRSHASIIHWVCSNESTEVGGIEPLVRELTGTESWMMASEVDGVHDGSPYFPVNPMRYYHDEASPRGSRLYGFSPEYGTCALPSVEALREFMPEELLWPVKKNAEAWRYREGGGFDKMTEQHHALVMAYGKADSIDEYAMRSEAADAMTHLTLWEVWNAIRNTATGVLFWYNNTPVPQIGSHAWDYGLEQGAAFFAQKRALEPLHPQYDYRTRRVLVTSDVPEAKHLVLRAEVWDIRTQKTWEKSCNVFLPGETVLEFFEVPEAKGVEFVRLSLEECGKTVGSQLYWRSADAYGGMNSMTGPCASGFAALGDLPRTTLQYERTSTGTKTIAKIRNTGAKLAFMTRIKFLTKDGKRVRGTFFDDNYFTLFPGDEKAVTADGVPRDAVMMVYAWNADGRMEVARSGDDR